MVTESFNYIYDGQQFKSSGSMLSAMRRDYQRGNRSEVMDTLEYYGFDLGDIGC